jgi:hypothetical protein
MVPMKQSIDVRVPTDRLFTYLAATWEAGAGLGGGLRQRGPEPAARMGNGFCTRCPARLWHLPDDAELTVSDYTPAEGWRAASAEPPVSWEIRLAPAGSDRTRVTCRIDHRPPRPAHRFLERMVGRRRRARTLRRLLRSWRDDAERQEALRRLRSIREPEGSGPDADPGRRGRFTHTERRKTCTDDARYHAC